MINLFFLLWLGTISWLDCRFQIVPNYWQLPGVFLAALIFHQHRFRGEEFYIHIVLVLSALIVGWVFWVTGCWGGADARVYMILQLAAPSLVLGFGIMVCLTFAILVEKMVSNQRYRIPAVPLMAAAYLVIEVVS